MAPFRSVDPGQLLTAAALALGSALVRQIAASVSNAVWARAMAMWRQRRK